MKGGVEAKWVLGKSSGGENNILNVVSNSPILPLVDPITDGYLHFHSSYRIRPIDLLTRMEYMHTCGPDMCL